MAHLYTIEHIDLGESNYAFPQNEGGNGKYYVFWFEDIPLAHLFIEPGKKLTSAELHIKVSNIIAETIQFYDKQPESVDLKRWLKDNSVSDWAVKFREIISIKVPLAIQYVVPVTIIICTRNRPLLLETCLTGLQKLWCIAEEIIVVDNNSDDDSSKLVVEKFNKIKYVTESRKGLDIARNTGLLHSTKPIVAYTDDDVTVHPLWLHHIWESFRNESVGAMTGLIIASSLETEAQTIFEKYWSFNRGYIDKFYDKVFF